MKLDIKKIIKNQINKFLMNFNLVLVNHSINKDMIKLLKNYPVIKLINNTKKVNFNNLIKYSSFSKSQILQDLFVLEHFNFKKNGYFVEFGACDGVNLSNTHLLEKKFQWSGILCEPSTYFKKFLEKNRICNKEFKCVYSDTGNFVNFSETSTKERSTILSYLNADGQINRRKTTKTYQVETISLNDLLDKYNCPSNFEYLSIDTEGSEFEILKKLNFKKYMPQVITIEHNYNKKIRKNIYNLLIKNNYKRVCSNISYFDDWYIQQKL
tara:strand:- start:98 stop:901 length:804 start_codon:yes stop_codon:yes gene_type:complete